MRRVLAGLFAMLIVVLAAPTASAQESVSVSIGGVGDGQTIRGSQNVSASASAGTGVDSLTLIIAGYTASSTEPSGVQNNADVSYPWDTRHLPNSASWTRNGSYAITARVRSNGGNTREVTINVTVDNDATAPTGLNANANNNEGVVRLSWNRNPEPDVSAYKVERDGAAIGETQDTSFTDQTSPGTYSYRVIALRGGYATPSGSVSVTLEAPPPPPEPEPGESPYEEPNPSDEPYYQDHPQSAGGDQQQDPNGYGSFPSGGGDGTCYDCDTGCFSCGYDGGGNSDAESRLFGGVDDFTAKGLPGAIFAPGWGSAGLPALPGVPRPPASYPLEWGTYEENLPYDLSAGREIVVPGGDNAGYLTRTIRTIIPPDGLRWVAVGILMIVSAGMMRTIGSRLAPPTKLS